MVHALNKRKATIRELMHLEPNAEARATSDVYSEASIELDELDTLANEHGLPAEEALLYEGETLDEDEGDGIEGEHDRLTPSPPSTPLKLPPRKVSIARLSETTCR